MCPSLAIHISVGVKVFDARLLMFMLMMALINMIKHENMCLK